MEELETPELESLGSDLKDALTAMLEAAAAAAAEELLTDNADLEHFVRKFRTGMVSNLPDVDTKVLDRVIAQVAGYLQYVSVGLDEAPDAQNVVLNLSEIMATASVLELVDKSRAEAEKAEDTDKIQEAFEKGASEGE